MISYPAHAGGTLTRVIEAGTGAETVIFIHGVGANAGRWRNNLEPIAAAGYRCMALDLPGHGFAQKGPAFAYGVMGYAEFIERFLAERSIKRANFVGTSLGAHIAAMVACRHPEVVKSLILVGATGLFPIGAEASRNIASRIVDRGRAGIERKLKVVMFDDSVVGSETIDEEWMINNSPGADEAFARLADYFVRQIDSDAVGERLAALGAAIPKVLIWGEQDRSVPLAIGQKAQELLGGVPLRVIAEAAHAPHLEKPQAFNEIVVNFLGEITQD
jgi:2-hydroxy-6-oxonona-2,4-dienedioate hydrolase